MKKISKIILVIALILCIIIIIASSCSADKNAMQSETAENHKLGALVNNKSAYNVLSNVYLFEDVEGIYIQHQLQEALSRCIYFNDIEQYIKIKFLRKNKNYYYTYFDTDLGKYFLFFDNEERLVSTLKLCNINIKINEFNLLKVGDRLSDVICIDASTVIFSKCCKLLNRDEPNTNVITSEHTLEDGSIIAIEYEKTIEDLVVKEICIYNQFAQTYIDQILPMDLAMGNGENVS